jgi:hypothetical protein
MKRKKKHQSYIQAAPCTVDFKEDDLVSQVVEEVCAKDLTGIEL